MTTAPATAAHRKIESNHRDNETNPTKRPGPVILVQAPAKDVPIVVLRVAAEISLGLESVGVVRAKENGEEIADEGDETGDGRQEGIGVVERHGSSLVCGVRACGERGRLVHSCADV
jgi:hypothetical protein